MLDLKLDRPATLPKDAATIILVRNGVHGVEVFCVERSQKSRFLGGAIVFPGGKVDPSDGAEAWAPLVTPARAPFADDPALAIAAERETLEEAAMLHVAGGTITQAEVLALRAKLAADPPALRAFLVERKLELDLSALHPFSRWVTPTAESRRYDARFFVAIAPDGQTGAHDEHETTSSFWATPAEVLRRWEAGEVQVAPPTHCTFALLATCATAEAAIEVAAKATLAPICPELVAAGDTLALTLPGDPAHSVKERRAPGPTRYVLRDERWRPEDGPRA